MPAQIDVLFFILVKWNPVNMGINIWLICSSRKKSLYEYQVEDVCLCLLDVCAFSGTCKAKWMMIYSTYVFSLSFQRKCLWLLLDNNYQWPPVTCLLSLFTQLQLWENYKSISYSWTDICFVWEEKPLKPISSTHSIHSESLCALAVWINPVFSLPAMAGKRRENHHFFVLFNPIT